MRIVVCMHPPRAGAGPMGRDDGLALALALSLGPGHSVTALLAGEEDQVGPLLRALASGAGRAVRLIGDDFATADFHTLGQVLATGLRRIGADLVLLGARSDDDGLGAVSASTARHLGVVHVACIESLAVADAQAVDVSVRGGGRQRRLRVALPAVLSVAAGPPGPFAASDITGNPSAVESLSLIDPEATLVRRRTDLLGRPEPATRGAAEVSSAAALIDALARSSG